MNDEKSETTCELPGFGPIRQWKLHVRVGDFERGRTLRPGQSLVLGAADEADLKILDATVSALHCRVTVEATGIRVVDLGSRNGTYIGSGRVSEALLQGSIGSFAIGRTSVELREHCSRTDLDSMGLIGQSPSMVQLRERIRSFARLSKPVLILGESGTGKDVVAKALHHYSNRSGSYVETNVAAYPDSLIDSELFGHEKGAFTGAISSRTGLFEEAHRGTLFLDEIGDLSRAGQAKLLRVVEDGKIRALGTAGHKKLDVRLISATCVDLQKMMGEGTFRQDLFHRLSLLTIQIPPLRKRSSDIPLLANHLLRMVADELGQKYLVPATVEALKAYEWPGNVREMFAALYRAAVLAPGEELAPHLFNLKSAVQGHSRSRLYPEQAVELLALHENVSAAARAAGLPRSTFRSILRRVKDEDPSVE